MQMLMANGLINPAALCGLDAETAKLLGIAPAPAPSKTAQVLLHHFPHPLPIYFCRVFPRSCKF